MDDLEKAFDGRVFDRGGQALDLTVGGWVVRFCEAMFQSVGCAERVEAHWPSVCGGTVLRLLSKLDPIVGQNGVDVIGHGY